MSAYAELVTTSNFSFLRGGSHPEELVAMAQAQGHSALAITDRNSLAGVVRAHVAAKKLGLKLIVGARLVLVDAPDLICLPTDREAYARLTNLLTVGQRRAGKGDCILFLNDVAAHCAGCVFIVMPPADLPAQDTRFEARLGDIVAAVGADAAGIYLGGVFHYRGDDAARLAAMDRLGEAVGAPLVAVGDVLYHAPHRRPLQDVLACVREGCTIHEAGHLLEAHAERYVKPPREMTRLFCSLPDALARSIEISAKCRFSLDELVYEYPDEPVPDGLDPQGYLTEITWEGADWRYPEGVPDSVRQSIEGELAVIEQLSYAPYFLTVYDIMTFARSQGILCQGRGSAANSTVCYCLGITNVNPAEIDLLFDRFITPERKEPPDIDVDFEHERREEVIQYIYARYGREKAGLAATVISYRARSAVRDVGKALGLSEDTIGALAGTVWGSHGSGVKDGYVREAGLDPSDPVLARVLELARDLIGFPRHLSQHVGGFVLTRRPLSDVVPIGNAAMDDRTVIEWDKDDLDALGLLKVDVLALGMLTCIHRCLDLLSQHKRIDLTLANVPREDPAVYDMLCRADSIGVFQVESRAQMNMLPRMKPRTFYDLVIEVAIVRPGPIQGDMVHPYLRRRDGLEAESYPAPAPEHGPPDELRKILARTKGVPLFQEQAMKIAMDAAKFTADETNELRKAMATFRRRGTIGRLQKKMIGAMIERGYDPDFAERCFNQIKGFGEYGFPESHAASFAHLVYVSSWLKCHHPDVFCCAILNSQPMGFYAPAQLVRCAREHGVEVRPVDINHSDWDCTLERVVNRESGAVSFAVRLGLRMVDGMREEDGRRIAAVRDGLHDLPAFPSIEALWKATRVQNRALHALAAADSFRSIKLDRRQALWQVNALCRAGGQSDPLPLFAWCDANEAGDEPEVDLPQMPLSEHVIHDYQTLRLSLKAHPMSFLRSTFARERAVTCLDLKTFGDGQQAMLAGVVLVRQRPGSAKGVVFITLEDETGVANLVVWPKTLEAYRKIIMGGRLLFVRGKVQRSGDIIHLVCAHLEDRTDMLSHLSDGVFEEESVAVPLARADEVLRPGPDNGGHNPGEKRREREQRWTRATWMPGKHPRDERVIPKSRDFH